MVFFSYFLSFFLLLATLTQCCDVLVNTNSYDAFNGWNVGNGILMGFYETSTSIPSTLSTVITKEEIIERKFVRSDSKLCLYGNDSEKVKNEFIRRNIWEEEKIENLEDSSFLLPKQLVTPNSESLISPQYLRVLTEEEDILLLHVSNGSEPEKSQFINGTIHFDTDLIESPPIWNLHPCSELYPIFLDHGIHSTRKIVLYDPKSCLMASTRVFMALRKCGVKDIRILNGGVEGWKNEGFEVVQNCSEKTPVDIFGQKMKFSQNFFIDPTFVHDYVSSSTNENNNIFLLDTRSLKEHKGKISGYVYTEKKGRIPKSIFFGESFLALDQISFRPYTEIEQKLVQLGIEKEDQDNNNNIVIFYCGTGWRASAMWFLASEMCGYKNVFVYDGGWNEWHRDHKNPIMPINSEL